MQDNHLPQHRQAGKNIRGCNFSQEYLPTELPAVIAGQPILVRAGLIVVISVFCLMSGIVAGYFGAVFFFYITLPHEQSRIEILWMILIVIAWIVTTIRKGIAKGVKVAIISFLIALFITALLVKFKFIQTSTPNIDPLVDHMIQNLAATPVGMICAIISLFTGSFSLALTSAIFNKSKYTLRGIGAFLIIITAVMITVASYELGWLDNKPAEDSISVRVITMLGGTLSGFGVVIVSLIATSFSKKHRSQFDFLRTWAIAFSSWRGTSFYNLDLSGVNFRNAKLANTDLRARKLYRTCLQGVTGLDRARVDSRYLDLENSNVQRLLTQGYSEDKNFSALNLRGAYLQGADMRHFNLSDTDLTGADLQSADLRGSILVRAQVIGVDFTDANLTGICIEDWSVNSQTCFTEVQCDYIYRKLDEKGELTDRYPINRNFEPREFESLYQEVGNVVELIFKEGVNWRAFSFSLQKLQIEENGLGLELKGFEKRGDRWVVKVTHNESASRQEVEQRVYEMYNEMKNLVAAKEQQINQLLGIITNLSKQSFGNSFLITGSTITNLAGSGEINYDEAAGQVRNIVANGSDPSQVTTVAQNLLHQLQGQSVATSSDKQAEFIQQVILTEAQKDPIFKQFLVQQGQQIAEALPESAIASAIQNAIAQLT